MQLPGEVSELGEVFRQLFGAVFCPMEDDGLTLLGPKQLVEGVDLRAVRNGEQPMLGGQEPLRR